MRHQPPRKRFVRRCLKPALLVKRGGTNFCRNANGKSAADTAGCVMALRRHKLLPDGKQLPCRAVMK